MQPARSCVHYMHHTTAHSTFDSPSATEQLPGPAVKGKPVTSCGYTHSPDKVHVLCTHERICADPTQNLSSEDSDLMQCMHVHSQTLTGSHLPLFLLSCNPFSGPLVISSKCSIASHYNSHSYPPPPSHTAPYCAAMLCNNSNRPSHIMRSCTCFRNMQKMRRAAHLHVCLQSKSIQTREGSEGSSIEPGGHV